LILKRGAQPSEQAAARAAQKDPPGNERKNELRWQEVDPQTRQARLVPELQPRERRVMGYGVKRRADGSEETREVRAVDLKRFTGEKVHFAELDRNVREQPVHVSFLLSAVMRERPEEGTILNIDGAVIGFRHRAPQVEGEPATHAELVTMDIDPAGNTIWQPTRIYYPLGADPAFAGSPKMCVRLDHAARSWTLLFRDIVLAEDLPLFATGEQPVVSLRAGLPGDTAWLKELKVRASPPGRPADALPMAANGRLDLAKAHAEGDRRVIRLEVADADRKTRGNGKEAGP